MIKVEIVKNNPMAVVLGGEAQYIVDIYDDKRKIGKRFHCSGRPDKNTIEDLKKRL